LDNFSIDGLVLLVVVFEMDVVFSWRKFSLLFDDEALVVVVVRIRIELSWVILLFEELLDSAAWLVLPVITFWATVVDETVVDCLLVLLFFLFVAELDLRPFDCFEDPLVFILD